MLKDDTTADGAVIVEVAIVESMTETDVAVLCLVYY
jgi:hypothetical protein